MSNYIVYRSILLRFYYKAGVYYGYYTFILQYIIMYI